MEQTPMKNKKFSILKLLLAAGVIIGVAYASQLKKAPPEIVLAINPAQQHSQIQENTNMIASCFKEVEGLNVKVLIPQNSQAVVEAMGSGRVDIAVVTLSPYALMREKNIGEAHLMVTREDNEFAFQGAIYVHADSNIQSLEELNGADFAFPDPNSTSGRIFVLKKLRDNGIKPGKILYTQSASGVISAVYNKTVKAGGAFWNSVVVNGIPQDARHTVAAQYPDVAEKVIVFEKTDPIPNDAVVLRKNLAPEIKQKIVSGFLTCIQRHPRLLSSVQATGLVRVDDSHYDEAIDFLKQVLEADEKENQ